MTPQIAASAQSPARVATHWISLCERERLKRELNDRVAWNTPNLPSQDLTVHIYSFHRGLGLDFKSCDGFVRQSHACLMGHPHSLGSYSIVGTID
jgi:hypothetical protein